MAQQMYQPDIGPSLVHCRLLHEYKFNKANRLITITQFDVTDICVCLSNSKVTHNLCMYADFSNVVNKFITCCI